MMKGEMTIEVLAIAIVAVITVSTIYVMFTQKQEAPVVEIPEKSVECEGPDDCPGNQICIRAGNPLPSKFCGCLTSYHCGGSTCGVDNKCQ